MYNSENSSNHEFVNQGENTVNQGENTVNQGENTVNQGENTVNQGENTVNQEDPMGLGDVLGRLSEILRDDKMQNLANMDVSDIEKDMNNMVEELKKRNDPNIMSMLNLFNNLSISNLTDSNFSLGDCDVSNLGNQNTFSDTSEDEIDEDYEENNDDNSSTDTDEDLLNYMKDREENEDMVLSIKQKLEEID
jgi:hypothetical protein